MVLHRWGIAATCVLLLAGCMDLPGRGPDQANDPVENRDDAGTSGATKPSPAMEVRLEPGFAATLDKENGRLLVNGSEPSVMYYEIRFFTHQIDVGNPVSIQLTWELGPHTLAAQAIGSYDMHVVPGPAIIVPVVVAPQEDLSGQSATLQVAISTDPHLTPAVASYGLQFS